MYLTRLTSALLAVAIFCFSSARAAVLVIGSTGASQSLSAAIARAHEFDTIRITSGEYIESNVLIDKAVTIQGDGWPRIAAGTTGSILIIKKPGVTVSGILFSNTPVSFVKENAAILLDAVKNCRITGNRFSDNFFAVYAANSAHCTISGNTITGSAKEVIAAGNGIHLWYCRDMTITDNLVTGHRDGIYFEFVRNSNITNNSVQGNLRYGLHFMFSDSCRYEGNRFIKNGSGVAVMYTHYITMCNNTFQESWGGAAYGLLLKDIRHANIVGNTFEKNSIAIHMDGADHITIDGNVISDNGWAIRILGNCLGDTIVNNDFINNSFQVATNSRHTRSVFANNYWSTYSGYDLDRNGFGDVAYRPVSLYSLLVESNPPTLVLLRSLTIELLNMAERIIPTLTPETLTDATPRMVPLQ